MACLSKNGKELLRIEVEYDITNDPSITWERIQRAFFANGRILQKRDVRFRPSPYQPKGEHYSYGWKRFAKARPDKTGEDLANHYRQRIAEKAETTKWRIVNDALPVVILSQSRIMRAIESGEMVGFCKACGASQSNCEPDARNYTCESCGRPEVYGAEECLMAL